MSPEEGDPRWPHYRALADYGSARGGAHVFFFRDAKIYYGGQVTGASEHGAFALNGGRSPLGRAGNANLVWDESSRDSYTAIDRGLFTRGDDDDPDDAVCQPFLIRFEDREEMRGTYVSSDDFYFGLGEYPYPLPTNSMRGMGFCTMTPGETTALLQLLRDNPRGRLEPASELDVRLAADPLLYEPSYDIDSPSEASFESQLEASVIANPELLPERLRPGDATVCRQVPICPFKPENMDRADICYFDTNLKDGTVPDTIIELKNTGAGASAARQVRKYCRWIEQRHPDVADEVTLVVYAPRFKRTFDDPDYIGEYADEVVQWEFGSTKPNETQTELDNF
jgi:hypothetical protein